MGEACKWLCSHFLVFMCCNLIIVPLGMLSPCLAAVSSSGLTICKRKPSSVTVTKPHPRNRDEEKQKRTPYPVAICIVNVGKTSDRLLTTTGTIRHVVGMQAKLGLLVHQLQHSPVRHLPNRNSIIQNSQKISNQIGNGGGYEPRRPRR